VPLPQPIIQYFNSPTLLTRSSTDPIFCVSAKQEESGPNNLMVRRAIQAELIVEDVKLWLSMLDNDRSVCPPDEDRSFLIQN